jgi:mono/diheme cytochrome c family protein
MRKRWNAQSMLYGMLFLPGRAVRIGADLASGDRADSVPAPGSFPAGMVERGAVLARLGDCAVCHTADGGRPLAGGRALATPFGTLYSDNLTPDPDTGIGTWSAEAFRRAMKDGVSRTGSHLYPALPYEHFTHVSDGDLDALYAFLMTRRPVRQRRPLTG